MGELTKIQWCDHTFNPVVGCEPISPGCKFCYAKALVERFGKDFSNRVRTGETNWKQPVKWNRIYTEEVAKCEALRVSHLRPRRPRVFCASLSDWLDKEWPIEVLADLLKLIHDTPNLDWLLLTKRPENWRERILSAIKYSWERENANLIREKNFTGKNWVLTLDKWLGGEPPRNVWIGTTIEHRDYLEPRGKALLDIPARVHFISHEPAVSMVDFRPYLGPDKVNWLITGGESHPDKNKARPYYTTWARKIIRQCREAGVWPFVKQMGSYCLDLDTNKRLELADKKGGDMAEWPEDLRVREFPKLKEAS
jgi:protein gp37